MTDLTALTTPFSLLDRKTQEALKAHGGPWELLDMSGSWYYLDAPSWQANSTYRVKPAPPKPREWFLGCDGGYRHVYDTREEAQTYVDHNTNAVLVHVREVLPSTPTRKETT